MKRLSLILLILITFSGCSDMFEIEETIYLIKKGKHQSQVENSINPKGLRSLKSEAMSLTVRFDESVRYHLGNGNQQDINKLFGFADCNSLHHENSARFGWNYNSTTDRVDVYSYVYQNGKRIYEKMGSMEIGQSVEMSISLAHDEYRFWFKDQTISIKRGTSCQRGIYYLLYPYFGGNEVAPQDIRVYITEHL